MSESYKNPYLWAGGIFPVLVHPTLGEITIKAVEDIGSLLSLWVG
jgi:hypothetical protein